jgi:hypothetical protein
VTVQGPNVKKLIVHKLSLDAVPAGGGLTSAIEFLSDPKRITDGARAATSWVETAIAAVKAAPGNTFGDNDEAIAGEILRQIDERIRARAPK